MNQTHPLIRILSDMKTRLGLAIAIPVLILVTIAANSGNEIHAGNQPASASPTRVVRVEILGLRQDRIDRARAAILSVPGVEGVEFNIKTREARVRFNVETTRMRELEHRIRSAGFTPWFH